MRHILAILVQNQPGVLARVVGLFRRRAFNIESLAVGVTDNTGISRITVVVDGDPYIVEQICKQLHKLIEVIKISDLNADNSVSRELALVKVHADPARRAQILQLVDIFRAKVVDVGKKAMVIEVTGTQDKVEALINLAREFGIQEIVRTGLIALERGQQSVRYEKEEPVHDQDVL